VSGTFYGPLATLYDNVVVDPCFPQWADFLHRRWVGDPAHVARVLDVGCGTGLLAHELIDRGYEVAGLDGSAAMLAHARRRLGPDTVLVESVLPRIPDLGRFEAAISTFDTLNYLTPDDFEATMPAVAARLRAGGWWIFDLHTDALFHLMAEQPHSEGAEAGWTFTLDSTVDSAARSCRTRFSATRPLPDGAAVRDGEVERVDEEHVQFFFTDAQIESALDAAGFDLIDVVDEYTDAPRTDATLRATWIARRV
jgi:SAM-dependent methyltransferase